MFDWKSGSDSGTRFCLALGASPEITVSADLFNCYVLVTKSKSRLPTTSHLRIHLRSRLKCRRTYSRTLWGRKSSKPTRPLCKWLEDSCHFLCVFELNLIGGKIVLLLCYIRFNCDGERTCNSYFLIWCRWCWYMFFFKIGNWTRLRVQCFNCMENWRFRNWRTGIQFELHFYQVRRLNFWLSRIKSTLILIEYQIQLNISVFTFMLWLFLRCAPILDDSRVNFSKQIHQNRNRTRSIIVYFCWSSGSNISNWTSLQFKCALVGPKCVLL